MKFLKFVTLLVFLLLLGGFGYLALTDVPIQQTEVSKDIPNERFFND